MKVYELINILQNCDDDAEIHINGSELSDNIDDYGDTIELWEA